MKKYFITMMGLLVILSCGQKPQSSSDDEEGEEKTELKTKVYTYKFDDEPKQMNVEISVEYPENGSKNLVNAIREAINEEMGGNYEGSLDEGQKMIDFYGKESEKRLLNQDGIDEEYYAGSYYRVYVEKVYETDKLVTFSFQEMGCTAGAAHGYQTNYGITFRKSDGRRFDTDMLKDVNSDKFRAMVKDGLKQYFHDSSGESIANDEDLKEYILTDDDVNYLPLPRHAPYVTDKGVTFIYQEYEISFYAAGAPEFTVSVNKMKPYLTQTAKELLLEN